MRLRYYISEAAKNQGFMVRFFLASSIIMGIFDMIQSKFSRL